MNKRGNGLEGGSPPPSQGRENFVFGSEKKTVFDAYFGQRLLENDSLQIAMGQDDKHQALSMPFQIHPLYERAMYQEH